MLLDKLYINVRHLDIILAGRSHIQDLEML
jgi:hypothetical protein